MKANNPVDHKHERKHAHHDDHKHDHNFLSKLSDISIIAILCVLVTGMFSTGFYIGTQQADKESVEVRMEIKALRDSINASREATLLNKKK